MRPRSILAPFKKVDTAILPPSREEDEADSVFGTISTPSKAHMLGRFVARRIYFNRFIYVFDDALVEVTPFRTNSTGLRLFPRVFGLTFASRGYEDFEDGLRRKAVAIQALGEGVTSAEVDASIKGTLRFDVNEIVAVEVSQHGYGLSRGDRYVLAIRTTGGERKYMNEFTLGLYAWDPEQVIALMKPLLGDRLRASL